MPAIPSPRDEALPDWLTGITRLCAAASQASPMPDEAPGSARLQRLQREEAALDQYRSNIDALTGRLREQESRLDAIADDMLEARQLIARTCAGSVASADLARAARSLKALRDRLATAAAGTLPGISASHPAGHCDELWVADGVSHRTHAALPDIAALIGPLAGAIDLLDQPGRPRDAVAWRVEIDGSLRDLDAGFDTLDACIASIVNARNLLQVLSDNHTNVSLSNKHLAMSLGELDDDAAALLLQGHEVALQASRSGQQALAGLPLFDER